MNSRKWFCFWGAWSSGWLVFDTIHHDTSGIIVQSICLVLWMVLASWEDCLTRRRE